MLKLSVQNFRSHQNYQATFSNNLTIITGSNGSGKTSLIEAIYLAYNGKSWRSNFDEIIKNDSADNWFRIDLENTDIDDQRTVKYVNGQKLFIVNDKEYKRLPVSAKIPVILFEPNDMQLLYGSPSRRRQFIDRFISQIEPNHQTKLNKFERVLKQRNNLLKQEHFSPSEMRIWDEQFVNLSYEITRLRCQFLKKINEKIGDKYQEISSDNRSVTIRYLFGGSLDKAKLLSDISNYSERITPVGAQKDDYKFLFDGKDAKVTASRGENRSIIFAMLGVVTDIARETANSIVIVLLDDIDSELDRVHRQNLYQMSSWNSHAIATTLEYSGKNLHHIAL